MITKAPSVELNNCWNVLKTFAAVVFRRDLIQNFCKLNNLWLPATLNFWIKLDHDPTFAIYLFIDINICIIQYCILINKLKSKIFVIQKLIFDQIFQKTVWRIIKKWHFTNAQHHEMILKIWPMKSNATTFDFLRD